MNVTQQLQKGWRVESVPHRLWKTSPPRSARRHAERIASDDGFLDLTARLDAEVAPQLILETAELAMHAAVRHGLTLDVHLTGGGAILHRGPASHRALLALGGSPDDLRLEILNASGATTARGTLSAFSPAAAAALIADQLHMHARDARD
ncbi:hypothetical protein [Georgenia daeguensis]|uniref:Uncharacterized protein n=1 Tax=Georgenia daeguensis TaxID=908355 RepID=A0ABP6UNI9_9MICO